MLSDLNLNRFGYMCNKALKIIIEGQVQGVGIRPLIYRIAKTNSICGWVVNNGGNVTIFAQGHENKLDKFVALIESNPILNQQIQKFDNTPDNALTDFTIEQSVNSNSPKYIPQDRAICQECLDELFDPNNRRYHYPFISCTKCGPRFSLIKSFPLDRNNNSYVAHPLCDSCLREYSNPDNRRFHAQNISCPQCGPTLTLTSTEGRTYSNIISEASKLLEDGKIISIKSSSGYRLIADATSYQTVKRLRKRKNRPDKPFALMVENIDSVNKVCITTETDLTLLQSLENPILILPKKDNIDIASNVSPNINKLGIYLPGSGLEHILLKDFGKPIISTSANISGESLIYDNEIAKQKLKGIADAFIHHELEIINATDDSVIQTSQKSLPIRLARGFTPIETTLPYHIEEPIVALGAQDKVTLSVAWGNRLVTSSHIGDLNSHSCFLSLQNSLDTLLKLYNIEAKRYLIDKHPSYTSSQWIKKQNLPHTEILHHHAHASSLYLEMPQNEQALIFTWDGTGLGENQQLWGGETFLGRAGSWKRVASLRPFPLPGGEKCTKEIWRVGCSLLHSCGVELESKTEHMLMTKQIIASQINTPLNSSIGRLFDGAAAILGVLDKTSFDAQAAIYLENLATSNTKDFIKLELQKSSNGELIINYTPLIAALNNGQRSIEYRATLFHNSLSYLILDCSNHILKNSKIKNIGLTGGVFQNQLLSEKAQQLLNEVGYNVFTHSKTPCNDASISIGQIVEYISKK